MKALNLNPIWLPIETAPKDGSLILGWGIARGDWGYTPDLETMFIIFWSNNRWQTHQATPRYFNGFIPTHWIPIPLQAPQGGK